jgi:hypothetical protein
VGKREREAPDGARAGRIPKMSRRQLLAAAPVAAAAGLSTTVDAKVAEEWVTGRFGRVLADDVVELNASNRSRALRVELTEGAAILRDGQAALADFHFDEEVAIGGRWTGSDTFVAHELTAIYRTFTTKIDERRAGELSTPRAELQIGEITKPQDGGHGSERLRPTPLADLKTGDEIFVVGRRDPVADDEIIAVRIGEVE